MLRQHVPVRLRRIGRGVVRAVRESASPPPGAAGENNFDYPWPDFISPIPPDDLLTLGRHSYHRPKVEWYPGDEGRVRIGAFCSIHPTVKIFAGGSHRFDWVTSYGLRARLMLPGRFEDGANPFRGDVEIGNDVYIGTEAMILSGVRVGDGAVVAARAVVTRDVPPYAVVAGNPGEVRRFRFPEREREALGRVRWWNWDDDAVVAAVDALCSPDISAFLRAHDEHYAAES